MHVLDCDLGHLNGLRYSQKQILGIRVMLAWLDHGGEQAAGTMTHPDAIPGPMTPFYDIVPYRMYNALAVDGSCDRHSPTAANGLYHAAKMLSKNLPIYPLQIG